MVSFVVAKKLGRPSAVESGETRQRLLTEARRSFATVGFEATTNRSIAAAVGITTGTIYHYFTSKNEMYVAAFAQVQDLVHDAFETAAAQHETFAAKFSAILDAIAELGANDPSLASFVVGVSSEAQRHPELSDAIKSLRFARSQFLHKLCTDAVANGEIVDGIDAQVLHDLINVVMSGLSRFSTVVNNQERDRAVIAGLKRVVAEAALPAVAH
jgi:AcrR family transcriptional regulator